MAGPGSSSGGGGNYLQIIKGQFRQTVDENHRDAKLETPENGNSKYVVYHQYFDGAIKDVKTKDWAYKPNVDPLKMLVIVMDADGEEWEITCQFESGYATNFISRFVNGVGLGSFVRLYPYAVENEGKTHYGISIWKNADKEQKVESFWGAPGSGKSELPKWIDTGLKVKGATVWDKREYYAAMGKKMKEVLDSTRHLVVASAPISSGPKGKVEASTIPHVSFDEEEDQFPTDSTHSGVDPLPF